MRRDNFLDELLSLNPELMETTLTKGHRGGNIWIRIPKEDQIPKVIKIKNKDNEDVGEIRGTGGCTIVAGLHPKGVESGLIKTSLQQLLPQSNGPTRLRILSSRRGGMS